MIIGTFTKEQTNMIIKKNTGQSYKGFLIGPKLSSITFLINLIILSCIFLLWMAHYLFTYTKFALYYSTHPLLNFICRIASKVIVKTAG